MTERDYIAADFAAALAEDSEFMRTLEHWQRISEYYKRCIAVIDEYNRLFGPSIRYTYASGSTKDNP